MRGFGELANEGSKTVRALARRASQLDSAVLAENIRLGNIAPSTPAMGQGALNMGAATVKPVTDPWSKNQPSDGY
jgi:hypothetical protein